MAKENNILHICDPCRKERNLRAEEGYQSIRPCDVCVRFKGDGNNKPTSFVRTTLSRVDMNNVRREFGYTELGEPVE